MSNQDRKSCLTSGEWVTLLGTICTVLSPAFDWQYDKPKSFSAVGTLYIEREMNGSAFYKTGFEIHIGWIVALCGVVCGALLLLAPKGVERRVWLVLQVALGLTVLVLAIQHIGLLAGDILGLIGSVLLIVGGVLRYGGPAEPRPDSQSSA